ncbi:MAG: M23 family metallopeptidase [Bacteroidetes bacterium]|nr:M23 family metallopeptidase [Bacteroidota bacterium]
MRKLFLLICFCCGLQAVHAQEQKMDEVPESIQRETLEKLNIYKDKLAEVRKWVAYRRENDNTTSSRVGAIHTTFRWPMRVNSNYDDIPEFYTVSNYMDINRDSAGSSQDWRCYTGGMAMNYRGHEGNDYSLYPFFWRMQSNKNAFAVAGADGIVIAVRDSINNDLNCMRDNFEDDRANYVAVLHIDSSISRYLHIKTGSALVQEGQFVQEGQLLANIASSGNSSNPHLHFDVQDTRDNTGAYDFIEPFDKPTDNVFGTGCNPFITASRWQQQKNFINPQLLRVATHSGAPSMTGFINTSYTPNFCPEVELPRLKAQFAAGDFITVGAALSHVGRDDSVNVRILYPNKVQWTSGSLPVPNTSGSPVTGWFRNIYLVKSFQLPANAPSGTYTIISDFVYRPFDTTSQFGVYYPESAFQYRTIQTYFTVGCTPSITLSGAANFENGYIVSNDLVSTQQINAKVTYQSANYIQLNPGFVAPQGTVFKARIRDCNHSD